MPRTVIARVLLASAGLVLVAACTSGEEVDVDAFDVGVCPELAEQVQEVDRTLRQLADEDVEPKQAAATFADVQDELKPVGARADEPVASSVTELVARLGFFRISVDSNNYDGSQDADVRQALSRLAEDCTGT